MSIEFSADEALFGPDLPFDDLDLLGSILSTYGYYKDGYDSPFVDTCDDASYTTPTLEVAEGPVEGVSLSRGLLDRSPKKNWVEESGGLPKYIEDIAHDLHTERGMSISRAIAVAVSRVKVWAAGGGGVKPDTRAKAAAAVAEWEALKAKNHARRSAK